MKIFAGFNSLFASVALTLALVPDRASAQISAQDNAAAYTTWTNGMNLGSGFTPWVLTQNNGNSGTSAGFFIGSSGNINVTNNSFGLYANSTNAVNTAYAIAYRGLSNSLAVNQVFKVNFQNTSILNGGWMGLCLRNNSLTDFTDTTILTDSGTRFAFYFAGGNNNYFIWDGSGAVDSGIGWTSSGLSLEFYLLTADTYLLIVKSADGSSTLANLTGTLAGAGASAITKFAGFNLQSGSYEDAYFNSLSVLAVTSIPPAIENLSPTSGTNFWPSGNGLSFDVTSLFSTVSSNGTKLTLNGVNQTNLTFTGSGTGTMHVNLNSALQDNINYSGSITAADANGNHTTNNFTFNTWLTSAANINNIYIEAGDYNFYFDVSDNINYGSGGQWLDNFTQSQPNQTYGDLGFLGSNRVDYLKYDLTGTNPPNLYRTNDLPNMEVCTDINHNGFAGQFTDYDLGYIKNGEWVNYTRHMSNISYTVYARMAGFPQQGGNTSMLMERIGAATVSSTNQPRTSMGTFVCPNTGGPQSWAFVPLTDFFSNPVQFRLPGTNTFRLTCLGSDGSYNLHYLILVPSTNTTVLHPFIASGYPYPNATGVAPDQTITLAIANAGTNRVVASGIKLNLNSNNVTSSILVSSNAAGASISYLPPALLSPGTNMLQAIFSDGLVSQTNTWQFTVASLPIIPPSYALQLNGTYSTGFAVKIAKASNTATNIDFPPTIARALTQLAGTLTNSQTSLPYANLAAGPNGDGTYVETNALNYDITSLPSGSWTFGTKTNFPYVPANGTNNYIALAVNMYVQLSAGVYTFAVRSDDGFELTTGSTPTSTNMFLASFDSGRANTTPTTFDFIVQTNGLYPMRLVYDQGQFGGSLEFYSINRTNGTATLINTASSSIKVYRTTSITAIPVAIQKIGTNMVLTWSDPTFSLQSAPLVTGTYTNITGATSPYTNPITGQQKYFRLIH